MMTTIEEAQDFLKSNSKGAVCPCCLRFIKTYKRKLNSGMAQTIISIYRNFSQRPVHINNFVVLGKTGLEYSKLIHWGLLDTSNETGFWHLTDKGIAFVKNEIEIPRHIFLHNNKLIGFGAETTNIQTALGDQFNYFELMES